MVADARPFPQMTTRRWMIAVVVVGVLLALALDAVRLKLRERSLIYQRAAETNENVLRGVEGRIMSIERRVAASEQAPALDPRHARWVKELADYREVAGRVRGVIPALRRAESHPWESSSSRAVFGELVLGDEDRQMLDREARGRFRFLAVTIGVALTLGLTLFAVRRTACYP